MFKSSFNASTDSFAGSDGSDGISGPQLTRVTTDNNEAFSAIFQSALDMLNETNQLQKQAEQAEINYALGYTDSTHDLALAQQKANIAIQYTVAVRDKILEAYKEIMNIQM